MIKTKQELLNHFSDINAMYNNPFEYQTLSNMIDELLEQQPCEDVLEKIKAEILDEAEYAYADFDRYKEDILHAEPDELPDDDFRYGLERAVEIINNYKAESEDKE